MRKYRVPCYSPLTAYYSATRGESGKRGITFQRSASFSGNPLQLPCGQCIGCRLERSRQWAVRCMHEYRMCFNAGFDSSFVTLTYDEKHLPDDGGLRKRDLQLFMKRLRKQTGEGVRFYACGEYGGQFGRPHYHVLLFNRGFDDKKLYSKAKRGEDLYDSASLRELWPMGRNVIGSVSFDSCAYVARYCVDKVTGDKADDWYQGRQPEFTCMSRRPGIGSSYYAKYGTEAYKHDSIVMNGREMRPPRFYDTRYELVDSVHLGELRKKRRRKALLQKADNLPDRRRVREVFELKKLALKKGFV